jgi:glycosyltransferase involved in cell wall biosynthesis
MKIALCHDQRIPPLKYGGTERVVAWLARALLDLGHEVTLISRAGSEVSGTRQIEFDPARTFEEQAPADIDLIHLNATPLKEPKRPYLVTIHGNGQPGETFLPNTCFVSRSHAENHGAFAYVHNGIEVSEYSCDLQRNETLVFLAKASWAVKNLDGAKAIAHRLGMRLEVLGSRDWPGGLHRWIPTVRGVRYRGMVDDREKRAVLRSARALLFPVRWHEPFGLAITEALASGCAVFGTPYGSLPEIVSPTVGRLGTSVSGLVRAVEEDLPKIAPLTCRAHVEQGPFSAQGMALAYLRLYETILSNGELDRRQSSQPPRTRTGLPGLSAQSLLPWSD